MYFKLLNFLSLIMIKHIQILKGLKFIQRDFNDIIVADDLLNTDIDLDGEYEFIILYMES